MTTATESEYQASFITSRTSSYIYITFALKAKPVCYLRYYTP